MLPLTTEIGSCPACGQAPCTWNGYYPDGTHTPYPEHEHEWHKCLRNGGNHEDTFVVRSARDGVFVMDLNWRQVTALSCYICRRDTTDGTDVVRTDLQVIDDIHGTDLQNRDYLLVRHLACTWPTWPCGCPYDARSKKELFW